jgi:hypothetical protein
VGYRQEEVRTAAQDAEVSGPRELTRATSSWG